MPACFLLSCIRKSASEEEMVQRGWVKSIICLLTISGLAAGSSVAYADIGRWQTSRGAGGGGEASLLSNNTLSTGNRSIEYHPMLTIGCLPSGWKQSVRLRDSLSGTGNVLLTVRVDGSQTSEIWRLGSRNSSLELEGGNGVARLLGARRLRLSWSNGFFSGTGEAVFSLAGIGEIVAQLAAICGIDPP
jgi:hypothetical protein